MGEQVFPVLATIILVATLITLIVAVASYVVFRVKEKKRQQVGVPAEEVTVETSDVVKVSKPHKRASDREDNTDIDTKTALKEKRTHHSTERKSIDDKRVKRQEDDDEEYTQFKPKKIRRSDIEDDMGNRNLGKAQSAFLNAFNEGNDDEKRGRNNDDDDEQQERKLMKFKQFNMNDNRKGKKDSASSKDDENAQWK